MEFSTQERLAALYVRYYWQTGNEAYLDRAMEVIPHDSGELNETP